jgi:hypothetical protein
VSPVTVKIFATGDVINSMGNISFWQYGTLTTCHQATIVGMEASGISATTAIGIGGYNSVVTSFLYGPYGMSGSGVVQGYIQYKENHYE